MATLTVYENGCSAGRGNGAPTGGMRGIVDGWSAASVRRHKQWLWSVQIDGLNGVGYGVTLTLRDTPETHTEWAALVARLHRAFREAGLLRWHWVVEWQRRGTPHLHLAVYAPPGWEVPISDSVGGWVVAIWLRLAAPYRVGEVAQTAIPITGPEGWLKYLSKHASRGVAHYQRQGKPAGWESTGRLWGKGGSWPLGEAIKLPLDGLLFHRFRRMVRSYVVADARAALLRTKPGTKEHRDARRRLVWARRMLRLNDPARSAARGVGEWLPGPVALEFALLAGWTGELKGEAAA